MIEHSIIHYKEGQIFNAEVYRKAVRAIIRRQEEILLIHSTNVGDYKFPGDAVEKQEDDSEAAGYARRSAEIEKAPLDKCTKFGTIRCCMSIGDMRLDVVFFRTDSGTEPVRKWLKSLSISHKKSIGEDIKTVQFSWPLGMPLVRKIEPYL